MGKRSEKRIEVASDWADFLSWLLCDQVIIGMSKTIFKRNPCKSKKCLVRASCTVVCDLRKDYLKFCDKDGRIFIQRASAITVYVSCIILLWALVTVIFK
jgi:hypothetical protein